MALAEYFLAFGFEPKKYACRLTQHRVVVNEVVQVGLSLDEQVLFERVNLRLAFALGDKFAQDERDSPLLPYGWLVRQNEPSTLNRFF
jgi:hypothetical protein